MSTPKIVDKVPVEVELEEGKTYAWCACGLSSKQPYCDGSHSSTDMTPKVFKSEETKTAYMCMCKHTHNPGFCDGTHSKL